MADLAKTGSLGLSQLAANAAQPEVPINENVLDLDAMAQLSVKSQALSAPPSDPAFGDRYLVAATGSGAWSGQSGNIAVALEDGGWRFVAPKPGFLMWDENTTALYVYNGTSWATV